MEATRCTGYERSALLRAAPLMTPLKRFLYSSNSQEDVSFSRMANPQANNNEVQRVEKSGSTAVQAPSLLAPSGGGYLLGDVRVPARRSLFEESALLGALIGGHDQQGLSRTTEEEKSLRNQKAVAENQSLSDLTSENSAPVKNVSKGQWTDEEDSLLIWLVRRYGVRKWSQIAKQLVGRIGKQCRERWHNHLRPDIKKDQWTEEEEIMLIEAHRMLGNRWAEIAKHIPRRSENSIKNHWNATKRRQNSKRKPKRRTEAAQAAERARPTILQEYIRWTTYYEPLGIQQHPVATPPPDSPAGGVQYQPVFFQGVTEQTLMADQGVFAKGLMIQEPSLVNGPIVTNNFESLDNYLLPAAGVGQGMIMNPSPNPNNLMVSNGLSYPGVLSSNNNTSIGHSFNSNSSSSNSSQFCVDNYMSYLLQGGASLSRAVQAQAPAPAPVNYMPILETSTAVLPPAINSQFYLNSISDMDLVEMMSLQFPYSQGSSSQHPNCTNFASSAGGHYNYF